MSAPPVGVEDTLDHPTLLVNPGEITAESTAEFMDSDPPSIIGLNDHTSPLGEEQALESHEVIELQTFSERKAWIEEKIKFLESLPAIEVFAGLEFVRSSAEEVPGLPTRAELQQWMVEHDAIEKETEIFDTGELTKLRQLTKAATQRNLSPEDTDVIELTLTTIYALDKLLHLLRDRSENREMLSIRLTWDENRQAAWKERRQIIENLHTFSVNRARWNPTIYESSKVDESPELARRNSIASLASASSDLSISSPAFSRSARFRLAELLSRDAAQFSGRVTCLRHGTVTAAGKALDKLIDHSRKPVPEDLLDEQDKLEEKCINELENIGKFTMSLVMQWRKADEIYVETMKDNSSSSTLLEEIETAKLYHPTARQSASFNSRVDTIVKRLAVRGDPALPANMFPCPEHFLFPDQRASNQALVQALSADITATTMLARKVVLAAKEYRISYEAVKRMETIQQSIGQFLTTLRTICKKYQEGVAGGDGDGSPPSLDSELCLDPTRHSVFLALLPSLSEETAQTVQGIDDFLQSAPPALFDLDLPGIDSQFKESAASDLQALKILRDEATKLHEEVSLRVARLREARRISSNIFSTLTTLQEIRTQMVAVMEKERWRQESVGEGAPPTPESPTSYLTAPNVDSTNFEYSLSQVGNELAKDAEIPFKILSTSLGPALQEHLKSCLADSRTKLEASHQMLQCLLAVRTQSTAMSSVREDFNAISMRMEDLEIQLQDAIEDVVQSEPQSIVTLAESDFQQGLDSVGAEVRSFTSTMTARVPFISRHTVISADQSMHSKPVSPLDGKFRSPSQTPIGLPFDLAFLDAAVRTDANSFAMRLHGKQETLVKTNSHLELALKAKYMDVAMIPLIRSVDNVVHALASHKDSFTKIPARTKAASAQYQTLLDELQITRTARTSTLRSFSPIKGLLRDMEEISRSLESSTRDKHYCSRNKALDDAELRLSREDQDVDILMQEVSLALSGELQYQEDLRLEEGRRRKAEQERLEAEESDRLRQEQERITKEEEQRRLQEQMETEQRQQLEQERIAAEAVEMERIRREEEETQRRLQAEEEQLAEQARLQAEQGRLAREEAVRVRQEKEHTEMVERVRVAEAQLEEERRQYAENKRAAAELVGKREMELKVLERRQSEIERQAAEKEYELNFKLNQVPPADGVQFLFQTSPTSQKSPGEASDDPRPDGNYPDIFSIFQAPSRSLVSLPRDLINLQSQILSLRKRLRSICIGQAVRPTKPTANLPTADEVKHMNDAFSAVSSEIDKLPNTVDDKNINLELQTLRGDMEDSTLLLQQLAKLVSMSSAIHLCDAALSDLLEHIDSYPSVPLGLLSSTHESSPNLQPQEQLTARLIFTKDVIANMQAQFTQVAKDNRAASEHTRISQTWSELEEMATDKTRGQKSRPNSATSRYSSGRSSSISINPPGATSARAARKKGSYSHLSVSSVSIPPRGGMLAPPPSRHHTPRRAISGSNENQSRPASRISAVSPMRSVSGPLNASIYGSTFASRQRTTSLSATNSTPTQHPPQPPARTRLQSESKRSKSPISESSTQSLLSMPPSRSRTGSSWSRTPRDSLSSILPRVTTPSRRAILPIRKKYVPDPKSKLDVAVGDVVNQLPVGINIEGVAESWRDQSGKYWIGDQDPKLCFCRILRSQTVMVRVGGGWTELSRFIKDHFAESFRIVPESPPRYGAQEEKWISSTTLLEAQEQDNPPAPPRTPEPKMPFVPSFSLMTPGGQSPHSIRSSPSTKGSPLTPLQFIRRADLEPTLLRPGTPSKPPTRNRASNTNTPSRTSVWRP